MNLSSNRGLIVVRGAGEMASGVIARLFRSGFSLIALEQSSPSCIRRGVCFAESVYEGETVVENIRAKIVDGVDDVTGCFQQRVVPILVDREAKSLAKLQPLALVDARLLKKKIDHENNSAEVVIGLGPGFVVGENCSAAIETNRGFNLGRVLYKGSPVADTGRPGTIGGVTTERVLRSNDDGLFIAESQIGDSIRAGEIVGSVNGNNICASISGILRGLVRDNLTVTKGQKIGDVDPRGIREYCYRISDKANAIAGGVLEALLNLTNR